MSILQPFGRDIGQGDLHRSVNLLNTGLKVIRFGVRGGASELFWEVKPKRTVRVLK